MKNKGITGNAAELMSYWRGGEVPQTIKLAAVYAGQRPGFDPCDYGGNASGYRSDSRRALKGLQACREAFRAAYYADVTDLDMMEASRGQRFSIEYRENLMRAEYTTGQYWPTEYRWGVAETVSRAASIAKRRAKQARVLA